MGEAEIPYVSCVNCVCKATKKCGDCNSIIYCSENCRRLYGNSHKTECYIQSLINILNNFKIDKTNSDDKKVCNTKLDDITRVLCRNETEITDDTQSLISCGNSVDIISHLYNLKPIFIPMKDNFGRTKNIEILQQLVLIENNKITAVGMAVQTKSYLQKCIKHGDKIDIWYTYAVNKDDPQGISAIIPKTYNKNSWIICCKEEIGEPVTVCGIINEAHSTKFEWSTKIWNTIPTKKIYNIINQKTQPELII